MTIRTNRKYRQGDVLIIAVNSIPSDATEVPRDNKRGIVLAEGEATGHAHRIPSRHTSLYRAQQRAPLPLFGGGDPGSPSAAAP